jgi:Tfp pilus assembly protein PilF
VLDVDGTLQLTAQLIKAEDESPLWGNSYQRKLGDVLALYNDVAGAIVGAIAAELTPAAQAALTEARPVDPEAYELYLRGLHKVAIFTRQDYYKAADYLRAAIEKDPTFAPAYAVLAMKAAGAGISVFKGPDIQPEAKAAVDKALEIGPSLAYSHAALGTYRGVFEWDWDGADEAFRHALSLDSQDALIHKNYNLYLCFMGRYDDALRESRRALELAPLDWMAKQLHGMTLYKARRWEDAVVQYRKNIALLEDTPNRAMESFTYKQLAATYLHQKEFEAAMAAVNKASKIWREAGLPGDCPECPWARLEIHIKWGRREEVEEEIQAMLDRGVLPWTAVALGDTAQALDGLEQLYEEHNTYMLQLNGPEFDGLRDSPRFQRLYDLMDFPG